jgi:hypothetical protein
MPNISKIDNSKFFKSSDPVGTPDDIPKGIPSKLDVYNMIKSILEEKKISLFEIDFLQVGKVKDKEEDAKNDMSQFGMVSGKFIYSEGKKIPRPASAFPIDVDNFELPIPGEIVIVVKYFGKNYYLDKITIDGLGSNYDPDIGKANLPDDLLKELKKRIKGYDAPSSPKKRQIIGQGGKIIGSRYGSTITLDHTEAKPKIKLSNHQSQIHSFPFFHSTFYNEGSTILLDSNMSLDFPAQVVENVKNMSNTIGNKVIINSDQLIFQSRDEPIHINSASELYINAPNVYINNEPAVLGKTLTEVLELITKLLEQMIKGIAADPVNASVLNVLDVTNQLINLKSQLKEYWAIPGHHNIKKISVDRLKAGDI